MWLSEASKSKNRQTMQWPKEKRTNNDLQNTIQKTIDWPK